MLLCIRELQQRIQQSSELKSRPDGKVDADKTAMQEVPSKEADFPKIASIIGGGDDLVSPGFNSRRNSWEKIPCHQLHTGLLEDHKQILAVIQDEMKLKYKAVPAHLTVRMWLSRAKELNLKIIEEMEYKEVEMMVKTCLQLIVEGSLLNVYPDIAHTPRRVLPTPAHPFVGQSTTFDGVVKLLHSGNNNSTIGIYGMGAVGKTALMQRVNNYLALTYDFHIVIWVHVSRGDDILLRVQRDILSRLGLPYYKDDKGQNQKSIRSSLLRLRFVLLLDELWEKLDLQEVGLPTSHTGKVVFTTRSKEVCNQMNAYEPISVECLARKEAHKLLQNYVGFKELSLGDSVADCCRRLPLALVIAGKHMKHNNRLENWRMTADVLRTVDYETGPSKPKTVLFFLLKLIYHDLPSNDSKLCLSAASSFPKYLAMKKEVLIQRWHEKKSPPGSTIDATDFEKGREIVRTLVDASLLESKGDYDPYVKLHPVLHDMLWWIEEKKEGWTKAAMKHAPNFLEDDDVKEMQKTMSTLPFKSSDPSNSPKIQEEFMLYDMPTTQHTEVLPYIGAGKSLAKRTTDDLPKATREAGDGSSSSHTAGLFKPDPIFTFPTEPSSSTLESAMDCKDKDERIRTIEEEATNKVSDIGQAERVETEVPSAKSHVGPQVGPSSKHNDEHLYLPAEEEPSGKLLVGIAFAGKSSSPSNDNIITETDPADRGKSSLVALEISPADSGESSLVAPPTDKLTSKQKEICDEILKLLRGDNITMVALWGPRGMGKSTLLKIIETEAQRLSSFEVVIRVVLLASGNIEQKIMDDIAHGLGVVTRSQDQQRRDIHHKLLHRSLLLLIDDLKESSELKNIGIPLPLKNIGIPLPLKHNSGKIVFTMTSSHAPQYRDCQAVEVARLDQTEAWELFKKELDNETLINSNLTVSEEIVKEAHGQPLAIKLLAGVMKRKHTPQEWQDMTLQMKESTEPDLVKIYRFCLNSLTINSLPSDDIIDCFMYTSLFPKDFWINEIDLIEYWIGEGFLSSAGSNSVTVNEAIKIGQDVLELLKAANLLEEQAQNRLIHRAVKMHDALRDMDLWDRGTFAKWKTELLVEAGVGLNEAPPYEKWETAKRISIMANKITGFRKAPRCNRLITLLLNQNHHLRELPPKFFKFTPLLQVLDLSHCGLQTLPPSIGKVVKLQYLNLSSTDIDCLPKELEKLTKLKCLKLRETTALHSIPEGILSKFENLQLLDMFNSGFALRKENFDKIIAEMKGLGQLGIVGICVENFGSLERLSEELAPKLAFLRMSYCVDTVSIELLPAFRTMESLRELYISSCPSLENITVHREQGESTDKIQKLTALEALYVRHNNYLKNFQGTEPPQQVLENLRKLEVSYCPLVKSVSWVQCLPNLINFVIEYNDTITDLFGRRMAATQGCFPKLRFMTLRNLSSLDNIGDSMNFPSIEYLVISRCPKVSKLPAGILNKNLKEIHGDIKWWKNLIWADEKFKSDLLPLYKREVTLWD